MLKYDAFIHGWLTLLSLTDHHVFKFQTVLKEMESFKKEVARCRDQDLPVDGNVDFDMWGRRFDAACERDRLPRIFFSKEVKDGQVV